VKGHVPERDGILACLLAAEIVASRGGARLRTLLQELYAEVGTFVTKRLSVRWSERGRALQERLEQPPGNVAGLAVIESQAVWTGLKLILEDGSWLLFRFPGTEPGGPVLRRAATEEHPTG